MTLTIDVRDGTTPILTALLVLVAAACNGQGGGGGTPAVQTRTQNQSDRSEKRPDSPAAPPSAVGLRVAQSATHGAYLTDRGGRALYLLESNQRTSDSCRDRCLAIWPPLYAGQAAPVAADSVVAARLTGTIRRADGLPQVTYNGHALYYYLGDGGPGQTLGHHVEDSWGEWYLVSPQGGEIDEHRKGPRDDDRLEDRRRRR